MPVVNPVVARQMRRHVRLQVTTRVQVAFDHCALVRAINQARCITNQQRLADMSDAGQATFFNQAQLVVQLECTAATAIKPTQLNKHVAAQQPVLRQSGRTAEQQVKV
ncbi:hypothetical protein D9M71_767200 [compost metagenome]